jgi:predicted membrane chloride channel (bestrophin family)
MGDEDLLNAVAQRIVRMGMAVPAVFFIESTKPLSFVGSQVLVFLEPFVSAFLTIRNYQRFTRLMEDRKNLETLIQRIETLDEEARRAEKERKAEAKRRRAEEKARKRGETSRG